MRRAPIIVTATIVGTAGVLLFKPLPASSLTGTGSSAGTSDSTADSGSSSAQGSTAPGSTAGTGAAASTPSSSAAASGSTKAVSTTATGAVETDRYGNTQVKVTIDNGTITDVSVLQYNDGDPRSAQISQQAIPTLRAEVLSKQTAAVDAVSGATYTSNAYEASLQAALDTAGFAAADGSTASTDLASADANLRGH